MKYRLFVARQILTVEVIDKLLADGTLKIYSNGIKEIDGAIVRRGFTLPRNILNYRVDKFHISCEMFVLKKS